MTVLSLTPHCSHKMQPLDRTVYEPLKTYVNRACDAWIANQPEQTMTIYDSPGIINTSLNFAATPANIKAGLLATGVISYNRDVFPDEEFLSSYVTDRPAAVTDRAASNESNAKNNHDESAEPGPSSTNSPESGPSKRTRVEPDPSPSTSFIPEVARPFPKAAGRKVSANNTRRKRTTAILTDTPVKAALREKQNSKHVTKRRTHQNESKRCRFNNPARESKKKKKRSEKNSDCSDENGGETLFGLHGWILKQCSGGSMGSVYPMPNVGP